MIDYEAKWRDSLCPFFKPVNAIHLILMIVRFANDGQKLTHWYLLYGSTTLSLLLITIAIEFKRAIIDYVHIWIIFVRILVTFTLTYLVTTGTEGFEHIDLKELCQAIDFMAAIYLVLTFVNWKFNLIVTAPVTMISCYIATKMSLTPMDDNMACFKEHETFFRWVSGKLANEQSLSLWSCLLCTSVHSWTLNWPPKFWETARIITESLWQLARWGHHLC